MTIDMKLGNDRYLIFIRTKNATERYYRDRAGWVKVSTRGRRFPATAEQVLNHLLPVLAGLKPNLTITVEHRDPLPRTIVPRPDAPRRRRISPSRSGGG